MILDRRLAVLGLKMACEANPSPEDWPTHGAWVCESCSAGGDWLAMRKAPSSAHLRFVGFLSHGPQWWLCYAMLGVVLGKRLPSLVVDVQVFEGLFEAVFEPFLLNNLDEWCTTFCMKSTLLIKNDFIFLVFFSFFLTVSIYYHEKTGRNFQPEVSSLWQIIDKKPFTPWPN